MLMMRNADLDLCKLAPEHEMWSWSLDLRMIFRLQFSPKSSPLPVLDTETPANRPTLFLSPFSSPLPHIHFYFLRTIMVTSIDYPFRASVSINLELLTQHWSLSPVHQRQLPSSFYFSFPFSHKFFPLWRSIIDGEYFHRWSRVFWFSYYISFYLTNGIRYQRAAWY